jgi:hypothetical protein
MTTKYIYIKTKLDYVNYCNTSLYKEFIDWLVFNQENIENIKIRNKNNKLWLKIIFKGIGISDYLAYQIRAFLGDNPISISEDLYRGYVGMDYIKEESEQEWKDI